MRGTDETAGVGITREGQSTSRAQPNAEERRSEPEPTGSIRHSVAHTGRETCSPRRLGTIAGWLQARTGDIKWDKGRRFARCDAMNFHLCLDAIRELAG